MLWQAFVFWFLAVFLSWVLDHCCLACCPGLVAFYVVAVCFVLLWQLVAPFLTLVVAVLSLSCSVFVAMRLPGGKDSQLQLFWLAHLVCTFCE